MEALEILKAYLWNRENEKILMYPVSRVKQAIDELQELKLKLKDAESYVEGINNVSCKSCKHHLSDNEKFPLSCMECSLFYGNKWEAK
jgi:hypothetical protein